MAKAAGSAGRKATEVRYGTWQFQEKLDAFMGQIRERAELSIFEVSENPTTGYLTLGRIVVPERLRGMGRGEKAMRALTAFADANNRTLDLTPEPIGLTGRGVVTATKRLERWYRNFGFVRNAGRYRDFATRESMIRVPRG